ncbi:MAG: hypothetical protein HND53_03065 [Proteobacteria bacterium]|nr:hypothetical protein [Pseudomonadota bacterium]NOG59452.1 hypothetical protein [Pseudomonadota bacterium]
MKNLASKFGVFLLLCPVLAHADWSVITHTDTNNNSETQVAYTQNEEGYSLEIYKDHVGAIRSRFSLSTALDILAKRSCPTYQIDASLLDNRSVNDAPCLTDLAWSEFILGYTENNVVSSEKLNALMNGSTVTFRFMLENGSYKETYFSLSGSKRATLSALGPEISIAP